MERHLNFLFWVQLRGLGVGSGKVVLPCNQIRNKQVSGEVVLDFSARLILANEFFFSQAIRKKYLVAKFYNISALPHFKSPHTHAFLAKMALKN